MRQLFLCGSHRRQSLGTPWEKLSRIIAPAISIVAEETRGGHCHSRRVPRSGMAGTLDDETTHIQIAKAKSFSRVFATTNTQEAKVAIWCYRCRTRVVK